MGILPFKCGIDGCKKSKMQKHTHTFGDLSRSSADRAYIEQLRAFAIMRGESPSQYSIPGGSTQDLNNNLRAQVAQGNKEAAEFRKRVSKEYREMKKTDRRATEKQAEEKVRKTFKFKKKR